MKASNMNKAKICFIVQLSEAKLCENGKTIMIKVIPERKINQGMGYFIKRSGKQIHLNRLLQRNMIIAAFALDGINACCFMPGSDLNHCTLGVR